ncbi:DUF2293 domain-containing protein [Phytoactinopolyspora endophytica]|uniref:DUF2293 domain-containing protein n=1 Tax=Phytoactinopolyspora endophytica TaxID=1642495 RepID=UPI00101D663D|nr:DUF2293 domain-containing protein [Phytoactinopolyspora endophytica]
MAKVSLRRKVIAAAEDLLEEQRYVSAADLLSGLGWVHPANIERWRTGKIKHLQDLLPVPPERLADAVDHLTEWARERGLQPREVEYIASTRSREPLTFIAGATPEDERALRTHWFAPDYSPAQVEKVVDRQSKPPDLVVVIPTKEWACASCTASGDFLVMENDEPLCLDCADMGHLEFLPSGNTALTRRAKKASQLSAVVIRWARSRKRYERQGILVEESALAHAEEQCLADADLRERRRERDRERRQHEDVEFQAQLAAEILRLYPACPPDRAEAIARHAGTRGSGRVGRSAAGRTFDQRAVTLAVVASVRHTDTDYDTLLMAGMPREDARDRVATAIDHKLHEWQQTPA